MFPYDYLVLIKADGSKLYLRADAADGANKKQKTSHFWSIWFPAELWGFMLYIHNLPSISAMAAPAPDSDFAKDLRDLHLVYDYNVQDAHGNPDKWRYEIWFFSEVCGISLFLPPVPVCL